MTIMMSAVLYLGVVGLPLLLFGLALLGDRLAGAPPPRCSAAMAVVSATSTRPTRLHGRPTIRRPCPSRSRLTRL